MFNPDPDPLFFFLIGHKHLDRIRSPSALSPSILLYYRAIKLTKLGQIETSFSTQSPSYKQASIQTIDTGLQGELELIVDLHISLGM